MLIAFCGIDGTGKSSHHENITEWLMEQTPKVESFNPIKDNEVYFQSFLEITRDYKEKYKRPIEDSVEGILLGFELFRKNREVEEMLKNGSIVVVDRWVYSHYAYSYARQAENELLFLMLEKCRKPDLVFLLDVSVDIALERIDKRGARSLNEDQNILQKAREKYLMMAQENDFIIIDSTNSFEDNQKIIKECILKKIIG